MKFVISRSKWLRGSKKNSVLLDNTGKMCCLGFYATSLGVSEADIAGKATPESAYTVEWPEWVRTYACSSDRRSFDSDSILEIIDTNDSPDLTDSQRERRLTRHFARQGIKVRFVS